MSAHADTQTHTLHNLCCTTLHELFGRIYLLIFPWKFCSVCAKMKRNSFSCGFLDMKTVFALRTSPSRHRLTELAFCQDPEPNRSGQSVFAEYRVKERLARLSISVSYWKSCSVEHQPLGHWWEGGMSWVHRKAVQTLGGSCTHR